MKKELILPKPIKGLIYKIKNQNVMLDSDLASLYGVQTKALIQAVKRNRDRFPRDFIFLLEYQDVIALRSQFVTSKSQGGRRTMPYVFTEQGVAMLSSVLKSKKAIQVNIEIMRTFVSMRKVISTNLHILKKVETLEKKFQSHDEQIKTIFSVIKQMIQPEVDEKPKIGFKT